MKILKALILDDLIDFLDFYFHHFPQKILRKYFDNIYSWESSIKLRANLRNFFKPLYGDYSVLGRVIGLVYRTISILFGTIFYSLLFLVYLFFVLIWLGLPIFLIVKAFL